MRSYMLLTGCRKSEALNATWSQFDLSDRVWTKPSAETKQRREHRVPYSSAVAPILKRRRSKAAAGQVFAGSTGSALQDVRRRWAAVCKSADTRSVRLHDLRQIFAKRKVLPRGRRKTSRSRLFGELLADAHAKTCGAMQDPRFRRNPLVEAQCLLPDPATGDEFFASLHRLA